MRLKPTEIYKKHIKISTKSREKQKKDCLVVKKTFTLQIVYGNIILKVTITIFSTQVFWEKFDFQYALEPGLTAHFM